ncbi:hypothetical protein SK128_012738 [Halocaridina rubra]|uniref:Major facilitator superfamily (MFS) profile domain-containing protein n=1 Tax=Halocaridina rubra TaxID=373956 RepID=A0AAN8WV23_HALRR
MSSIAVLLIVRCNILHFRRLGRRATVRYGSFVVVATVIVIGLCPLYTVILLCRALLGLALSSIIYPCYNLVMEITPTKQRTIVGMILCAPYSIAVMIVALLGYYIRSWRGLHLASSVFAFLLLPVSWFMDESPRWLVQENRLEEAKNILEKAAYRNRSSFSHSGIVVAYPPPLEWELNATQDMHYFHVDVQLYSMHTQLCPNPIMCFHSYSEQSEPDGRQRIFITRSETLLQQEIYGCNNNCNAYHLVFDGYCLFGDPFECR